MDCRFSLLIITIVAMIVSTICSQESNSYRKGKTEVFHLLLGLYNLKPLKGSQVYKSFSKHVLGRGENVNVPLNVDTILNTIRHEPIPQKTEIENGLDPEMRRSHKLYIEEPAYDIENIDAENFYVDLALQHKLAGQLKQQYPKRAYSHERSDNFSSLNHHYGNNIDVNNNITATPQLPIDDLIFSNILTELELPPNEVKLQNLKKSNRNNFLGFKNKPIVLDNNVQDSVVLRANGVMADVIVL